MHYSPGLLFDFIYFIVLIIVIIFVTILLIKIGKKKPDPKYADKEYLRTLELPELRFVMVGAKDAKIIKEVIEEKIRKL